MNKKRKYPYLTFKIIAPSLLLILVIIFGCAYFFGGLKASAIAYNNEYWDEEGFIDMNPYSSAEKTSELNKSKLVASNTKYVMFIDETTTIVSVYAKNSGWSETLPLENVTLLYRSAIPNAATTSNSANITLTYYDSNGKSTEINSYDKCVQYLNVTKGSYERHYKIRYNEDSNSVDIMYEMGDFAPYIFPKQYDYKEFVDTFIGNCIFSTNKAIKNEVTVLDAEGNPIELATKDATGTKGVTDTAIALKYSTLVILTNEAAKYLLKNNLATIYHSTDSSKADKKFSEYTDDIGEYIDSKKDGFWIGDNIYDESGNLKMKLGVDYNCNPSADGSEVSPIKLNPFMYYEMFSKLVDSFYSVKVEAGSTKVIKYDNYTEIMTNEKPVFQVTTDGGKSPIALNNAYNFMYVGEYIQNDDGINIYNKHEAYDNLVSTGTKKQYFYDYNEDGIYTEDEYFQYGGYPLVDEDGNYVYTEDGLRCVQDAFTVEMAIEQNEVFGNVENTKKTSFTLALRFALTNNGMDVTLLHDSIKEDAEEDEDGVSLIGQVQICKYMTTSAYDVGSEKPGQIIIPDGSGAIIQFNSQKSAQFVDKYQEKRIYGSDAAINMAMRGNAIEKLMLGMYGFLEIGDQKGTVCIVDEGAAQVAFTADIQRPKADDGTASTSPYNYAYYNAYLRESEDVKVTTVTYKKITNARYQGDIKYKYYFLQGDELDYVDVANVYRNYLIEKYSIVDKEDTTKVATPTITFIGAYEKKALKAGIVMDAEYSLTTFAQARDIVSELMSNGIESLNVVYRFWTDDEKDQKTTTKVDVSNVIGGKGDMKELSTYLKNVGVNFYPEYKVAIGRGYDLLFGGLKYTSKSISGSYSNALTYVLSTGLEDNEGRRGNYISPIYYQSLLSKYLKRFNRLGTSGIYLSDIGNMNIADYSRNIQLFSAGGSLYQQTALAKTIESVDNVMLNSPYDYAIQYVDVATVVPVQTTLYEIVDCSIPLYQLIISGLFDYSSKPVNYENDYSITWNLLKAIETGSNLSFVLSAEDTNVLLETNYTEYYNSYYTNWKENISYMINKLNSTGIYESRLVGHEYLSDNVVKVTYENGLEIIINYDKENYQDSITGLTIASNWYAIIKKGGSN